MTAALHEQDHHSDMTSDPDAAARASHHESDRR